MMKNNCLIAGLPAAGKSTYIAALYSIEKEGDSGHALTCVKYPDNTSYLDGLRKCWLGMKVVNRTTLVEPAGIELVMKLKDNQEELTLKIPDFKGESYSNIVLNNISNELEQWCDESDSILFFIRNLQPITLQDELPKDEKEQKEERIAQVDMELNDIPEMIQNIIVLKYLYQKMGKCKISVCVSAWDEIDNLEEGESVEAWIKRNFPFLFQFIETHFESPVYFGVSAQGVNYNDKKVSHTELIKRTEERKRAYIYRKKKDFDITKPLVALLEGND